MLTQKKILTTGHRWIRRQCHSIDRALRIAMPWPWRRLWRIKRLRPIVRPLLRFSTVHYRLSAGLLAVLLIFSVVSPVFLNYSRDQQYVLSSSAQTLLGKANPTLADKIKLNQTTQVYEFNGSSKKAATAAGQNPVTQLTNQVGGNGAKDTQQYSVDMPQDPSKGVTYYENTMGLSFTLVPKFTTLSGEMRDNRVIYPLQNGLDGQLAYTAQADGLKEDIVLNKNPGANQVVMQYKLQLPDSLEARLIPQTGEIGIYSADPALYGNISYGSSDDQARVEQVRTKSAKTYLVFKVPAPYVMGLQHGVASRAALQSRFVLSKDTKTLSIVTAGFSAMKKSAFPLSIDPSVTVSSSSNFATGNDEDGNVSVSTSGIARQTVTGGTTNAWASTTSLPGGTAPRQTHKVIVNNGYMYVVGGFITSSVPTEIRGAAILSDGTLGSWTVMGNLSAGRARLQAVAYNGYLYVLGGSTTNNSAAGTVLNTVEYAPFNSDGTIGTWQTTTSFTTPRINAGAVVYDGHIYMMGGNDNGSATTYYADVQYATIMASGALGSWASTTVLPAARSSFMIGVSNGYIYVVGGVSSSGSRTVPTWYAALNSDGSVGTWIVTQNPNNRSDGAVAVYGGYIYVYGGYNYISGTGSVYLNDVQYASLNANGSLGIWQTGTSFTTGRLGTAGAAYNGYLYVVSGVSTTTTLQDVQYASIATAGAAGNFTTGNAFTYTRRGLQAVVYNNYLYVMGGDHGSTPVNTIYAAHLNADGSMGTFTATGMTAFNTVRTLFAAVAYNGYMYVMGGCLSIFTSCTTGSNDVATVYYSAISSTGTLGAWSPTTSLPVAVYGLSAFAYNGYMYVMGGINAATYKSTVYYSAISSTGTLGSWTTATSNALPSARSYMGATVYGGYAYIVGGCTAGISNTCTAQLTDVYYAKLNGTGGGFATAWTATSNFTTARYGMGLVAINGFLYMAGGKANLTNFYNDTQYAPINADGSVGTWVTSSVTLANMSAGMGSAAANGQMYMAGGFDGSTYYSNVQYAPINNGGSGTVQAWAAPSFGANPSGFPTSAQTIAVGNYVYEISNDTSGGGAKTTWYAPMTSNGGLGAWNRASTMNVARSSFGLTTLNGYLYVLGGYDGGSEIAGSEYAKINSDGSLGNWAIATAVLSGAQIRDSGIAVAYSSHAYLIGGNGTGDSAEVDYITPSTTTGDFTTWTATTSLPYTDYFPAATVYNGYIYVLGGGSAPGTALYNSVVYAPINSDGTIGTWAYATSFDGLQFTRSVAVDGYMYIVGGYNGSNLGTVQKAPINSNGTLGNWEYVTSLPTAAGLPDDVYTHNGYVYYMNYSTGVAYYAALNSTPRVAHYSKLINLGTSGALSSITYNGVLANGSADISYKTAGSDGIFGSSSNNLSSFSYTAASGCTVSNLIQYVLVFVTVDDSGVSPFGDSAVNNLTSLTVNAVPGRATPDVRMRMGKSFADAALQPYDTCSAGVDPTLAQNLYGQWNFAGNTNDSSGAANNGTIATGAGTVTLTDGHDGATNSAYNFDGAGAITTANAMSNPQTYSINAWFKTTSTAGGVLAGYANSQTSSSPSNYDRMLWMGTDGALHFGVYDGTNKQIVTSPASYNNGEWHMATAVISAGTGTILYVDGTQVASNPNTLSESYATGWWRIGEDTLSGWDSTASNYFTGALDDVRIYSVGLTATQVGELHAGPVMATIDQGLYGQWNFSGDANDSSNAGNNGTVATGTGTVTLTPNRKGLANNAYNFNGAGLITTTNTMNNPTDYSVNAWFKTTSTTGGVIVGDGDSQTATIPSNYDRLVWMGTDGKMHFGAYGAGAAQIINSTNSYNDGQWHMVTAVMSSSTGMRLYIDGTQVATSTNVGSQNYSGWWRIGEDGLVGWDSTASNYFTGMLDDIRIYNFDLTVTQVNTLYNL